MRLATANSIIASKLMVRASIPGLGNDAQILVLESCPRVLSLARLVEDDQCSFSWVPPGSRLDH
eukprot:2968891-Heterocapsa_arctica.AAC.1